MTQAGELLSFPASRASAVARGDHEVLEEGLDEVANTEPVDILVLGGGPAGATAALQAARAGRSVLLFEQSRHPRFHVGESLLPDNMRLLRELGLEDRLRGVPQQVKVGASFAFAGDVGAIDIRFRDGLLRGTEDTLNVERAHFDAALFEAAREAGATVLENTTVRRIVSLDDGDCRVETRDGDGAVREYAGRYLIDATGQGTVVGRHLGTRRTLRDLEKVAYFGHFTGVRREPGERGGYPIIVMCDEGWFWMIPLDDVRTSIGVVMDASIARELDVPAKRVLHWAIERCPFVRERIDPAGCPAEAGVTADFSYSCRPYAGPGYFLAGDAATFVDPIFSTGVCLGMMSAIAAADGIGEMLDGRYAPERVRRRYRRYVHGSSSVFFRLVRGYYRHAFRELLMNGSGPLQVHRAVISVLAGNVFPAPVFSLRWRLRLFDAFVRLQQILPLVPRRGRYSLRTAHPVVLASAAVAGARGPRPRRREG